MNIELFDFYLPEELIAQTPLKNRAESKMLTLNRKTGEIRHHHFKDIVDYLQPGDTLVLNDTKVLPARLFGIKKETGAKIEVLLLKQLENDRWETLVKPGKKLRVGHQIIFGDGLLTGIVEDMTEVGGRIIRFQYQGVFNEILDQLGQMPLPPYIKEQLEDKDRYQTVYAKNLGSAAAPTAGLHFTKELLEQIKEKGIEILYITLHVGLGTFRPVQAQNIEEHHMHSEFYSLSEEVAEKLNQAKSDGRRIIAVGTTSVRTLETVIDQESRRFIAKQGWTDIFIYPGYQFKAIDAMITNFHLPKSSLIMLVSALAGREQVMKAYREAIQHHYRFFSFGDAMFIY
ncbi:tRNA preQ1(34) S-adenosylmethionine ribosyltransferase-isomerase QueA [Tepidibacillus infernus]|uniref:S-adenosylmethionine:tRNA ribosyltransferase-isomerase n=1 Tax=Tepidibacillus decaturensis TaxID=1413211 RepID=A0A135L2A1_9BACI|nr:tRNA preQ1(34) S-adenosylmethionine ribosyltransferase-isomerase QueA [Tepidibacillus decaturensis]KXG43105.1 S-adenosylmethionine:tRNA ribosyltransferase-isomerase [Tepidibacillus decaturensis]